MSGDGGFQVKILYLNQIETNAGWGSECFYRDALEKEGVEAQCIAYLAHEFELARVIGGLDGDFDAVLLQRGCGYVFPSEILRAIRRPKVLLFTELVARNRDQYSLIGSGCFEHVFVRTPACRDFMVAEGWIGAEDCSVFLSSCPDEYLEEGGAGDEKVKDIDVLWIGTIQERRRAMLDRIGENFKVTEGRAFGSEMAELVRRAKVVVNLHAEEALDTETRVYEVLGSGGFLVTERLSEESPFRNGEHLVEAGTCNEVIECIGKYLEQPQERARIASAGREEVRRNHTYAERAKELRGVLEGVGANCDSNGASPIEATLLEKAAAQERSLERRAQVKSWLRPMARRVKRALQIQ
jgi:hypothetical protein